MNTLANHGHTVMPTGCVLVSLTPIGARAILYSVRGRVVCSRMNKEVRTSGSLEPDDLVWKWVFGSKKKVEAFLACGRVRVMVVKLSDLGFDACDTLQGGL